MRPGGCGRRRFAAGFSHPDIRDSKLLSSDQREKLVPIIKQTAVTWGLGVLEVEEIDCINILEASLLAMGKALRALRVHPDYLLVDGKQSLPAQFFRSKRIAAEIPPQQRTVIKGDQLCSRSQPHRFSQRWQGT